MFPSSLPESILPCSECLLWSTRWQRTGSFSGYLRRFMSTQAPVSWPSCLLEILQVKKRKKETHALTYIFPAVSHSLLHLVCALILGIMALLFEFSDTANLMAVASLLAYSMVSFSVLVLRWDFTTPWSESLGSRGWWGGHRGLCHTTF